MRRPDKGRASYRKLVEALKKRNQDVSSADVVAATGLPLPVVQELLPQAADEYSARLEVTDSGEILYRFPRIFISRYRGFKVYARRFLAALAHGTGLVAAWLFKVWIMVMLVGYFVLFMVIALAALVLSVAGSSSSSSINRSRNSGGGFFLASGIFDLIIRIWFYSELTRSFDRGAYPYYGGRSGKSPPGRPLHHAIFSFVFGEPDPNREAESAEKKALVAWLQQHAGVISLPEYLILTGKKLPEAEGGILAACSEFGGMPESTADGTIVYRFDQILLRADRTERSFGNSSAPVKQLRQFSANKKNMNTWFVVINTVNLLFGSYFIYNTFSTGAILSTEQIQMAPRIYGITYLLAYRFTANPLPLIAVGLGLIPVAFSVLFWLIPALRFFREKRENQGIKRENFRKIGFQRIWSKLRGITAGDLSGLGPESSPEKLDAVRDRLIKDMAAYSMPEVEADAEGNTIYHFVELEREKNAVIQYRAGINPLDSELGKTVFDSGN
jgi:hypothetical protein